MCSTCAEFLGPWAQLSGNGCEVIVLGPAVCPNGHPLRPPNVLKTSNAMFASYGCGTCRVWINRRHDELVEWITQGAPGPFGGSPIM